MDLYPFQSQASSYISEKFQEYIKDPLFRTRTEIIPFFFNLSAITGAGKTLILADTIAQMRLHVYPEPIVLWISRGKVVVSQTYENLSHGKYFENIPGFNVMPLLDCKTESIEKENEALLLIATVGKFNQKDMDKGDRMVYRVNLDSADNSLWDLLKNRINAASEKRPLFIVYDEGHNFSDQQTELLLQLDPDAILSASATMRIPELLQRKVIQRFIDDKGWSESDFSYIVKSSDVVASGLIKKHIIFGGYVSPMEMTVDSLISDYNILTQYIAENDVCLTPRAIYVSNTNIVSETGEKDNPLVLFSERRSSPIKIWRHLVENLSIDPDDIAVYCDLKVDSRFPLPKNFHLFSGGDNDYERFMSEDYRHIIFNLSLQEGWDDPLCYFAYIDKDMGSKDQVTQVIGRVLRQPDAHHYSYADLNAAHIYVRADSKNVVDEVVTEIGEKLAADMPEITFSISKSKKSKNSTTVDPVKKAFLPIITIEAVDSVFPIQGIVDSFEDYRKDDINTIGEGGKLLVQSTIGSKKEVKSDWVETKHTNKITARWLFKRELQKYHPRIANVCDTEKPLFDAMVEYSSKAANKIRKEAEEVVDAYFDYSKIIQDAGNIFEVPSVNIDSKTKYAFSNSVHPYYSDFNSFELEFAKELDKTKKTWFRNPKQGCFSIPLLDKGDSNTFNPDFIVWTQKTIFAIDTKADHLIVSDAARKLFSITKYGKGRDLVIKLVTEGEWTSDIKKIGGTGFTIWMLRSGRIFGQHSPNLKTCIKLCIS